MLSQKEHEYLVYLLEKSIEDKKQVWRSKQYVRNSPFGGHGVMAWNEAIPPRKWDKETKAIQKAIDILKSTPTKQ